MTRPRGIFCIHPSATTASSPGPDSDVSLGGDGRGVRVHNGYLLGIWAIITKCTSPLLQWKKWNALSHKQPVTKWAKTNFPWWSPDSSRIVKNLKNQNNIWWSRDETDPLQAAVPNPEIIETFRNMWGSWGELPGWIYFIFIQWDCVEVRQVAGDLWDTRGETCWGMSQHHLSLRGSPHYSAMSDARGSWITVFPHHNCIKHCRECQYVTIWPGHWQMPLSVWSA